MSSEAETKPKKGKGMVFMLVAGLGLVAIGGGGAFALVSAGMIGGHQEKEEPDHPKLVLKGEEDPYAVKPEGKEGEDAALDLEGEGGSKYRTTYFNFAEDFTSNLHNSEALVQLSLAASTRRDGRVLLWMKKHEMAIRSAVLAVLADTPEQDVYTMEGKDRLQKRLTAAINKVLTDAEGFGGIDAVYFKSFIVQ